LTIQALNIARSSSREAYIEAARQLAEFDAQLRDIQERAGRKPQAERRHVQATSDLETYAMRSAEAGEAPTAEGWLERGEAKRIAAAALQEAEAAERQYLALQPRRAALMDAKERALRAVIVEEGTKLAAERRRLELAAEKATVAVEALAHWAAYTADDGRLAGQLRDALSDLPKPTASDPGAYDRARRARNDAVAAFRQAWAALPERLASDPTASAPSLEADQ
jgi:hypothetical protein